MSFDIYFGTRPTTAAERERARAAKPCYCGGYYCVGDCGPEPEECLHEETECGVCSDCGADRSDVMCNRAHERSEGMER